MCKPCYKYFETRECFDAHPIIRETIKFRCYQLESGNVWNTGHCIPAFTSWHCLHNCWLIWWSTERIGRSVCELKYLCDRRLERRRETANNREVWAKKYSTVVFWFFHAMAKSVQMLLHAVSIKISFRKGCWKMLKTMQTNSLCEFTEPRVWARLKSLIQFRMYGQRLKRWQFDDRDCIVYATEIIFML